MTGPACDREDLRISLGALALDALDPAEAAEVRRHMAGCPECQVEYASFVGVRSVLDAGLAGAAAPAGARSPASRPETRVLGRRGRRTVPARRRVARLGAAVASVGLVVTAFFVGAATQGTESVAQQPGVPVVTGPAAPPLHVLPAVANAAGVTASVSYRSWPWGTWVGVKMNNVPVGYVCKLTAYGKDGTEATVSSWKAVPGQSSVTVNGSISMDAKAIDHFEVEVNAQGYDIAIPMTS